MEKHFLQTKLTIIDKQTFQNVPRISYPAAPVISVYVTIADDAVMLVMSVMLGVPGRVTEKIEKSNKESASSQNYPLKL